MNPKVDFYFDKSIKWLAELTYMRQLPLECGLMEELKWGCPCYTFQKSNIILIHTFRAYCAFLFFKGALLKDPSGILVRQTENVQGARQVRFTTLAEVRKHKSALKQYIYEAIEVEKRGLKIDFKKTTKFPIPEELTKKLNANPALKKAFNKLTPGRQRGYYLYFSQAKQSKTREARIERYAPFILLGKGLRDE